MILILVLSKADIMKGPLKQQRIATLLKSTLHIKVVNTKHMSMEFQIYAENKEMYDYINTKCTINAWKKT